MYRGKSSNHTPDEANNKWIKKDVQEETCWSKEMEHEAWNMEHCRVEWIYTEFLDHRGQWKA